MMASLVTERTIPLAMVCLLVGVVYPGVQAGGGSVIEEAEDGSSGSIKFSTPDLSDEEGHSPFMPINLKCDGCRVVAYQLYQKFVKATDARPKLNYKLPESDVLDLTEAVCTGKSTFENYGLKQVKKEKRLSGPGLETSDIPGVMQGGGKWPGRLMEMCEQYMAELDEMNVFNIFKKNPKSLKKFEKWLCYGDEGIRNYCDLAKKKEDMKAKDEL